MKRLNILAEGESEEEFVKRLLTDHLSARQIYPAVQCVVTSHEKRTGKKYKGGLTNYAKVKNHLLRWMKEDQDENAAFTTMFDLYRLPDDFPGYAAAMGNLDKYKRVEALERSLASDVGDRRLIPYIQLHEFEALILSQPGKFDSYFLRKEADIQKLGLSAKTFGSPELINDEVPPSKFIEQFLPNYSKVKVAASSTIAESIGLHAIRERCEHFHKWISELESL